MTTTVPETIEVLIVDDDLALLAFLITRLEYESDFRVVGYATDAAEGLRLARTLQPDIVLADFDLPDADGVEQVGAWRMALPGAAIVLYTGVWSEALERAARLHGGDVCLDKSMPPSDVVAALRDSLQARRSTLVR